MKEYDFLVIGTGVSGLTAALKAADLGRVAIVTKEGASDSNTSWAQGGICCVSDPDDSFEEHVQDTLIAGAGLCDEQVVREVVSDAPRAINEMVMRGVDFDREKNGAFSLGKEGGHGKRRILHHKDTTGKSIVDGLLARSLEHESIDIYENHFAVDLVTTSKLGHASENRVLGAYVLNEDSGEVEVFRSDRVFLCTGGSGRVYQYTTNPRVATGDGVAMAWRAGVTISNMEFTQFHPTCLFHPVRKNFLISEALRGEGAVLVDYYGNSFMEKYDPERLSLAPRDIVARAIDTEIKKTGKAHVYLDITHQKKDFVAERFPHIFDTCAELGIDISKQPIPVVPAAHYQCGGVKCDVNGATSLRGLCAIGEVGSTGLHGANRLASNSLLEGAVVADKSVDFMVAKLPLGSASQKFDIPAWESGNATDIDEMVVIYHNWDEIRQLMWDYVSIVRTTKRLQRAAARLRNLHREVREFYWDFKITAELLELRNLVETASLMVDCAVSRRESRGAHYTKDYPEKVDPPKDSVMRRY